jgi:hypothetical protein
MATFKMNGFGSIDDKVAAKIAAAKALGERVSYREGVSRRDYLKHALRVVGQYERLWGEAIGLYEAAAMPEKAAELRRRADRAIGDLESMVYVEITGKELTRGRAGRRGTAQMIRSAGPGMVRMGVFGLGGLGAGADVHERKAEGSLQRAQGSMQKAMKAINLSSFLSYYGEAMQSYGEAFAHLSSVLGRTYETDKLITDIAAAAASMRQRGESRFGSSQMRRSA